MRLVIAATALALSATGAPAQPVSTTPLARDELLLEIDAIGRVQNRADRVSAIVQLAATGGTAAEARSALERKRQSVLEAARAAGVPSDRFHPARVGGPFGFVGNEAMASAMVGAVQSDAHRESTTLELYLNDAGQFARVQGAIEAAGAESVLGPFYALSDETGARRAARADGLAHARADAEAYAASLRMRVSRMVRVSERVAADWSSFQAMQDWIQRVAGLRGSANPDIETQVRVSVDFALAPQ